MLANLGLLMPLAREGLRPWPAAGSPARAHTRRPVGEETVRDSSPRDAGRVAFENVSKVFGADRGRVAALDGVTFTIEPGEIFGIIGRSGAGKSTLLRLINALERPTSGRTLVGGVDVAALDKAELTRLRRRIGMIFQHFNLMSAKTVAENVALPLRIARVPRDRIDARVEELLAIVGLSAKRDAYPATLSGGQKQRVGIARALVHEPDILLCDEATSALDPETTQSILELLQEINRRLGVTIVLITHEMSVIRQVANRVAVLERGRLVEEGAVWNVFGAPQAEATRQLLATVAGAVPAELAQRLAPDRAGARHVVFALHLSGGEGVAPTFGALADALGPGGRLLHGGLDRLQGRAHGRLVVAADLADGTPPDTVLARLAGVSHSAEILGYAHHLD